MPSTETKCPVLPSSWGDSGGTSAHTAKWATGSRIIEPITTPKIIRVFFMVFPPY
jgi:hypothetical protein